MNVSTRKWLEIVRFEVSYQLRRKATWFFFAAFLMPLMGQTNGQVIHALGGEDLFDAPFLVAQSGAWMSLIALVVIAAVAGDAATRDVQLRMESLMHAAPLGRAVYLGGRFAGAFLVIVLLLVAVPLASMLGPYVHPGLGAEHVGLFRLAVYLQSYFVVIVPNAFVTTALLFALATLARHTIGSYLGAALVVAATLFSMQFVARTLNQWELAKLLDPIGIVALHVIEQTWSPVDRNARLSRDPSSAASPRPCSGRLCAGHRFLRKQLRFPRCQSRGMMRPQCGLLFV